MALFAGAPRVLCSLCKVDDEATRTLMVRFYELWSPRAGTGNPEGAREAAEPKPIGPAQAPRKAQAFVRTHPDHPEWKHPYYWAAWVFWGVPA